MGAILWVQLNCSSCNGLEEICCNIEYCLAWYTVWLACTGFGHLYVNCGRNNTLIESFNNILLFGCCSSLSQVPNFTNTHKTTQCDSSTFHKDKECSHLCYIWITEQCKKHVV